jgi:Flp pilus assembly protein TadD
MSVILDALRRSRGQVPERAAPSPPPPAVPSVLVARPIPTPTPKTGRPRWSMLAGIVVLAGVVWAGLQFGPRLLQPGATAAPVEITQPLSPEPVPDAVAAALPEPSAPRAQENTSSTPAETIEKIPERPAATPPTMPGTPVSRNAAAAKESTPRRGGPLGPPSLGAGAVRPPLPAAVVPVLTSPPPAAAAPTAVSHFALAVRYHRLGDFEQALTSYTAALQAEEFNVEARNNLGLLYHERGLADEAIEQFRRAILINPQYLRARSNLAVVLLEHGRLAEARAELRAALAIDARNVDLLVNMALVDKADRRPEQARETLIRALGLQASHAAAHYNLGVLYDEAGELARAQDHYNEFLKYAGPEYGTRLADVRRRIDVMAPSVTPPQP